MRWILEGLGLLRTAVFTAPLIYLSTLILGLVWVLVLPFDPSGARQHRLARFWSRVILGVCLIRVEVRGREKLEPGRPYVFVSNHQSYMDIPVLFGYLPAHFRILAKGSLFHVPIIGWYLRRNGHLPVTYKARADGRRLLQAIKYIQEGGSVAAFAEGGRSLSGAIEDFKPGIFLAALKGGAPIVPVTLRGSRRVMGRGSWHIRPGRIELILDAPVETAGLDKRQLDVLVAQVRQQIELNFSGASA